MHFLFHTFSVRSFYQSVCFVCAFVLTMFTTKLKLFYRDSFDLKVLFALTHAFRTLPLPAQKHWIFMQFAFIWTDKTVYHWSTGHNKRILYVCLWHNGLLLGHTHTAIKLQIKWWCLNYCWYHCHILPFVVKQWMCNAQCTLAHTHARFSMVLGFVWDPLWLVKKKSPKSSHSCLKSTATNSSCGLLRAPSSDSNWMNCMKLLIVITCIVNKQRMILFMRTGTSHETTTQFRW